MLTRTMPLAPRFLPSACSAMSSSSLCIPTITARLSRSGSRVGRCFACAMPGATPGSIAFPSATPVSLQRENNHPLVLLIPNIHMYFLFFS
jgi:hypothetical protein